MSKRNPIAYILRLDVFKRRVVPDKKKHNKKRERQDNAKSKLRKDESKQEAYHTKEK